MKHVLPPTNRLHEVLSYDLTTGIFIWKWRSNISRWWNTKYAGKQAGKIRPAGYIEIRIDGKRYQAGRLAWKIINGRDPIHEIDHKNTNKGDNRYVNLREATGSQNCANKPRMGALGKCVQLVTCGKYQARITKNGHRFSLGLFDTPSEAQYAYAMAARSIFGRYARV